MPDTVEQPVEAPVTIESNAGPLSLGQYAAEVETLTGEKVTNEPKPTADEATAEPQESAETSKEEPSKPKAAPKPKVEATPKPPAVPNYEEFFKDPRVQSEVDRRAAALERSRRQEEANKAAQEAERKARNDYELLVQRSRGPDYDEDAQAARAQLAEMASTQLMRDGLYQEVSPVIRETILGDLSDQYRKGYEAIPEFGFQEVMDRLHHSHYDNAGDWMADVVNGVSAIRIADRDRQWQEKFDDAVKDKATTMAEAMTAEQMAAYRTRLPNPDTSPSVSDGAEEKRYRSRAELRADIDKLLPKLGSGGYRALRDSLPEEE